MTSVVDGTLNFTVGINLAHTPGSSTLAVGSVDLGQELLSLSSLSVSQ